MVYLTFIRYAEAQADGCISVQDAEMLLLTAKFVVEKFGKPRTLYAASCDWGMQSAQIANLAGRTHCISEAPALNDCVSERDVWVFFYRARLEAERFNACHVVMICSASTFKCLFGQTLDSSCTIGASRWEDMLSRYFTFWPTLDFSSLPPDLAKRLAAKYCNVSCSDEDTAIIEKTLASYCVV